MADVSNSFNSLGQTTPIQGITGRPGIPVVQGSSGNDAGASDAQIKMLREYAAALMNEKNNAANAKGVKGGIGLGLENFTGKIASAQAMKDAADRERANEGPLAQSGKDQQLGFPGENTAAPGVPPQSPPSQAAGTPPQQMAQLQSPPQRQGQTSQGQSSMGQRETTPSGTSPRSQGATGSPDGLDLGGGAAEAAMRLSSKGETGRPTLNMGALFNISPDTSNSKSYGPFGLNSKTGSAAQFAKEHPNLGLTAKPGTPEFAAQWGRASTAQKPEMIDAHKDWHDKHIMSGLSEDLTKRGVNPNIANDPRVQTYFADRKLQMGTAGLNQAIGYAKGANSPEDFIHRTSMADRQGLGSNFKTYLRENPQNAHGLVNRINMRERDSLAMADPASTARLVDTYRGRTNGVQVAMNGPNAAPTNSLAAADMGGGPAKSDRPTYPREPYRQGPDETDEEPARDPLVRQPAQQQAPQQQQQQPPQQVAQNTTPGGVPTGTLQARDAQVYYDLITKGHRTPEQALDIITKGRIGRQGDVPNMPQFGINKDTGQVIQTEPGKMPSVAPGIPGYVTKRGQFGDSPAMFEQGIDKEGHPYNTIYPPNVVMPPGSSENKPEERPTTPPPQTRPPADVAATPPPPAPAPKTAPAPATAAPNTTAPAQTAPGGKVKAPGEEYAYPPAKGTSPLAPGSSPLSVNPPGVPAKPTAPATGPQTVQATPEGEGPRVRLASALAGAYVPSREEIASSDVKAKETYPERSPEGTGWRDEFERASKEPPPKLGAGIKPPDMRDPDDIMHWKQREEAFGKSLSNRQEKQDDASVKERQNIRDAGENGRRLSSTLKMVKESILTSPNLYQGPLAGAQTYITALRQQIGRFAAANPDIPVIGNLKSWKDLPGGEENQILAKALATGALESLRGMLGNNAGQFREYEMKLMRQALGSDELSPGAMRAVIEIVDRLNDRNIVKDQMASEWQKKNGLIDDRFDSAWSRYETNHPAFTPQDVEELMHPAGKGAASKEGAAAPPVAPGSPNEDALTKIQRAREKLGPK